MFFFFFFFQQQTAYEIYQCDWSSDVCSSDLMIELCRKAGLPGPDFQQREGSFVVTLWRDWLTDDVLAGAALSERQITGLTLLRLKGRLTSGKYQEQTGVSRQTTARDLEDMVKKGILERHGTRRGTFYTIVKKMTQL